MIKRPQSIVPEVLKALRRKFRVPDGMLNIAMPQVVSLLEPPHMEQRCSTPSIIAATSDAEHRFRWE